MALLPETATWLEYTAEQQDMWTFDGTELGGAPGLGTPDNGVFARDAYFWNNILYPVSILKPRVSHTSSLELRTC